VVSLHNYGVPTPTRDFLALLNTFALLSWCQPLLLRMGTLRGVMWLLLHCGLSIAVVMYWDGRETHNRLLDAVLVGNLCGVPGLVAIGARTRAWLSLVGGAMSVAVLSVVMWSGISPIHTNLPWFVMLSQAPYAAVMIYGTRRKER